MGARERSRWRADARAPVRTALAGGESRRRGSAVIARRRPAVAELRGADTVVRFDRQPSVGICCHYQRRWTSPDVVPRAVARTNGTHASNTRGRERLGVSSRGSTRTSSGRGPGPASSLHPVSSDLSLVPCASCGQRIVGYVLVYVYGLSMLSQVVEA